MLTPERFGREAVLHGTTSAMTDPHEIGNVCGMEGILWMVEDAKRSPMRQFNLASSCIPADAEFETVPFPIRAPQMAQLLDSPGVYGIAEVMDSNAVIADQPFMRDILAEGRKRDVVIQGHAPYVTGRNMSAYRLAGVMNTHTVLSAEDVRKHAHRHARQHAVFFPVHHVRPAKNGQGHGGHAVSGFPFRMHGRRACQGYAAARSCKRFAAGAAGCGGGSHGCDPLLHLESRP